MNINTTLRKIRRAGPAEIAGRIAEKMRLAKLRWAAKRPENRVTPLGISPKFAVSRCVDLVPGSGKQELHRLQLEYPKDHEAMQAFALERAEQIAGGRLKLLGKTVEISPDIPWDTDPHTGHRWPMDFFGDVSYHKIPDHVDFKDIWEIGRQQYVVDLSRSWLLNGNLDHGNLAREMILSWIDGNPFCMGIHWTSGLEVAIRSISWIWALANLRNFSGWESGDLDQVVHSLGEHAFYLEHHFSYYSSPYNHVIGEAAGLCLIASVLNGTTQAKRWERLAQQVLRDFGPRQFYADGFCVEQAVGYHYFTLGFLMLAELATRQSADERLGLDDHLEVAFRTGALFRQPNGLWPAIGDVDSAQAIPVSRKAYWDFSPTHQLAAVAFENADLACSTSNGHNIGHAPSGFGDEVYWLLGCDGLQRRDEMKVPDQENSSCTLLPNSGYFIAGNRDDQVVFDAGSIAHGLHPDSTPSTAHGHADTLQILYSLNGQPVLIDSGMPNYAGNSSRAAHFRSPQAHNTVAIENAEFVHAAGGLNWSHEVATPTLSRCDDDLIWAASGEVRWPDCAMTRHLLVLPGESLWIADVLRSEVPREAKWFWQFPFELGMALEDNEKTIRASNDNMALRATGTAPLSEGALLTGDLSSCKGWESPGYGELRPSTNLSYLAKFTEKLLVLTCIGRPQTIVRFSTEGIEAGFAEPESDGADVTWRRHHVNQGTWLLHA